MLCKYHSIYPHYSTDCRLWIWAQRLLVNVYLSGKCLSNKYCIALILLYASSKTLLFSVLKVLVNNKKNVLIHFHFQRRAQQLQVPGVLSNSSSRPRCAFKVFSSFLGRKKNKDSSLSHKLFWARCMFECCYSNHRRIALLRCVNK